jgi:hypothetical protein
MSQVDRAKLSAFDVTALAAGMFSTQHARLPSTAGSPRLLSSVVTRPIRNSARKKRGFQRNGLMDSPPTTSVICYNLIR